MAGGLLYARPNPKKIQCLRPRSLAYKLQHATEVAPLCR